MFGCPRPCSTPNIHEVLCVCVNMYPFSIECLSPTAGFADPSIAACQKLACMHMGQIHRLVLAAWRPECQSSTGWMAMGFHTSVSFGIGLSQLHSGQRAQGRGVVTPSLTQGTECGPGFCNPHSQHRAKRTVSSAGSSSSSLYNGGGSGGGGGGVYLGTGRRMSD